MLNIKFSIVQDDHDNWPRPYIMPWPELAARLAQHREGEKVGTALICCTFDGPRQKERVQERQLVALDVEKQKLAPHAPETIVAWLQMQRQAAVVWTTHSHKPDDIRYRIVMPMTKPIRVHQLHPDYTAGWSVDKVIPATMAARLKLTDMVDEGKYAANSLFFLARHPPGTSHHGSWFVEGDPLDSDRVVPEALMFHEGVQMRRAQLEALRKSREFPAELKALIDAFNDTHEIEDLLEKYGYKRLGGRWKSGHQSPSSAPATAIFPDGIGAYSWSQSDKDAGLGHVGEDGIFFDAFGLYLHYEHNNDFRAAIEAARNLYGKTSD